MNTKYVHMICSEIFKLDLQYFTVTGHIYIETDSKNMRLDFSNIVTILLMIMLISIHALNDQTLRIPK